jgi:Nuclear cap-binding protein subunit 3
MEEGTLLKESPLLKLNKCSDPSLRQNAILLHGSPISSLPTSNIFAYSSHFDAHPIGLEWIDDKTCILVFESKAVAVAAHQRLHKSTDEGADIDGFVTSKPIPVAVWPPQQRINDSLGTGDGLRGIVRMRWARKDDVKEKGARQKSQFYKKHGSTAGKETHEENAFPVSKRRRIGESDALIKAQLDDELDTFIAEDDATVDPPSPPSKMRSAHMEGGRSLLERTSVIRLHPSGRRATSSLPMSSRRDVDQYLEGPSRRGKRGKAGGNANAVYRSHKTQQELDDELDAFLNEKD